MALLDVPFSQQRASYVSGLSSRRSGSAATSQGFQAHLLQPSQVTEAALSGRPFGGEADSGSASDGSQMQTSLRGSASTGSLAHPPGIPHSGSTAELVALGLLGAGDPRDDSGGVDRTEYNSDLEGYDGRSSIRPSNSSGSMVGSTGGGSGGIESSPRVGGKGSLNAGGDPSGVTNAGTRSAGGMGVSLTNLDNMVRSQSVSSFHSDLFAGGAAVRTNSSESPSWGSYPANLDKAGGGRVGNAFNMSPTTAPLRGTTSRSSAGVRPSSSGDVSGADLSPHQFTGRGTAPRREVERGTTSWATGMRSSQRRPTTTGGGGGSSFDQRGNPSGPGGGAPTSGRSMVHNRSDTDLVASFSRLGFGQGGVSRWSPLMSPTASPLVGAPLLEEDPLDLELEGSSREAAGADGSMGTSSRGLRGGATGTRVEEASLGVRLPRHASYPSLALSRGNSGHGMEDLVYGALEHMTVGESATVNGNGSGGEGSNGNGGGLGPSGMSSSSLSGSTSGRISGRMVNSDADGGSNSGVMNSPAALGGYSSSPARSSSTQSPATSNQRSTQGLRQGPPDSSRVSQGSRHRSHPHPHPHAAGGGVGHDHPNSQSYDQGRGADGAMMSDGRYGLPSTSMMRDSVLGSPPGVIYSDLGGGYAAGGGAGGGGYDSMGAPGGMMDVPWGANQDPVSLYQALLMKQSLAAAHASGMRFPNMMPMTNGMGMNMMDMATIVAAAQAAQTASGRGPYGGSNVGGYPAMDPYGRRDGGPHQRMGPRAGMAGVDVGYGFHSGGGMSEGRMGARMGMGRGGGGMYDMVEDIGDGNVYQVQFKRSTRNFLLGKTCERDLQVNIPRGAEAWYAVLCGDHTEISCGPFMLKRQFTFCPFFT